MEYEIDQSLKITHRDQVRPQIQSPFSVGGGEGGKDVGCYVFVFTIEVASVDVVRLYRGSNSGKTHSVVACIREVIRPTFAFRALHSGVVLVVFV